MPAAALQHDLHLSRLLLEVIPPIMRSLRAYVRDIERSTLTVPQFRVLGFVSLQPCNNKQLADWNGVSLPAMSRMVDVLVKRKLLTRTPDTVDRRQVQLRLSKKGEVEFKRLHKTVQAKLAERMTHLTARDKKTLAAGLVELKELFREI